MSEEQVKAVIAGLDGVSEALTRGGFVVEAGQVFAGRQAIRALWSALHPVSDTPSEPAPK